MHNIPQYISPSIIRRGVDADSLRRSDFESDALLARLLGITISFYCADTSRSLVLKV